ncbi:hypothetical protein DC20_08090 [Rufibacter tibetensis]|uniref:NodB homology domain-containing protein n=1 Tax=Rufibacter tibetensis TaxID=512763 RepID=A0A0P0CR72_9BACT|nr:hypothetical protein DC20_08090 [Rufibacter tibetensis]
MLLASVFALSFLFPQSTQAQIAQGYEVATWQGFKPAAVSYTFDDNTSKQLTVALPLFNQYNFKTTLFTVTNWGPNWVGLRTAAQNGHEVASHTVSHASLNTLSVMGQETELQQSQTTINTNIPEAKCITIAYPNCNMGDVATIQKYYLAGRVCSGQIGPSTPGNFYQISSIIAGAQGAVKTAADFNAQVTSAKNSRGWCVFLMHGIDNDGGYSPLASAELASHLSYMNTNAADYWVATFANVVKYIKERNAVSLTEISLAPDSLQLTVQDNLEDNLYNVAITVRRQLPADWNNAKVYINRQLVSSTSSTVGGLRYVMFDVVPNGGEVHLAKSLVAGVQDLRNLAGVSVSPNPFTDGLSVKAASAFQYFLYSLDGKLVEEGKGKNAAQVGVTLAPGTYLLKLRQKDRVGASRVVKLN